jgi:hypothetical protein
MQKQNFKITYPSIPVTDKAFKYRNSAHTDITITFNKFRKEIKDAQRLQFNPDEDGEQGKGAVVQMPAQKIRRVNG